MTHKKRNLERLAMIADAAFAAAQTRLKEKAAAEAAVQAEIERLSEARNKVLETLVLSKDQGAAQVVCHGAWLTYAEQKRARLNTAQARARALALTERDAARKAFGRTQAVAELLRRARKRRAD